MILNSRAEDERMLRKRSSRGSGGCRSTRAQRQLPAEYQEQHVAAPRDRARVAQSDVTGTDALAQRVGGARSAHLDARRAALSL
jgi:hypothetical protein